MIRLFFWRLCPYLLLLYACFSAIICLDLPYYAYFVIRYFLFAIIHLYAYLSLIIPLSAPTILSFFGDYTLSLPYYALICSYYTLIFVRYYTLMGHVWGAKLTTRGKSGRVLRQTTTGSVQNYALQGTQKSVKSGAQNKRIISFLPRGRRDYTLVSGSLIVRLFGGPYAYNLALSRGF